ncbi:hypothetical protein [Hydrogenovibrio halophilus]|uniref:hypothetical protein n=1 Tax=Hydrogenovibrio halophilus TaxID=373391 RepID=UPI000377B0B4|nr:hypothetical protein [Hydrogenovibrio halophilus]
MGSQVSVQSKQGGLLSTLGKIPWMLLVVGFLIAAHVMQISLEGTPGYVFIGVAIAVLFIEMFKSGDISAMAFLLDQFWAVLNVALASGLLTFLYFVEGVQPHFYHWAGFAIILADALLNPFNAFRMALRNFDVQG